MIRFKIISVILSVAMLCPLLMPTIEVFAEETSALSESQVTESTDKKVPEETKKSEPNVSTMPNTTESEETKETKESANMTADNNMTESDESEDKKPEQTESVDPSESIVSDPTESSEKGQKETEPAETIESQVPSETEETVPDAKSEKRPAVSYKRKASKEVEIYKNKDNTCLGTTKIAAPVVPTNADAAWQGSYVYFGRYYDYDTYEFSPIKFRVLAPYTTVYGGTTLFLDSDISLFKQRFDSDSSEWAKSELKAYLNGDYIDPANGYFTASEVSAIATSCGNGGLTYDDSYLTYRYGSPVSVNDKVFLLDASEVMCRYYGYYPDCGWVDEDNDGKWSTGNVTIHNVTNHIKGGDHGYWWLRSARTDNSISDEAGEVHNHGLLAFDGVFDRDIGVAPALNINQSSIIFSTLISGSFNKAGAEYKLTVADDNLTIAVSSRQKIKSLGTNIIVPYEISGTNAEIATCASVLILDKSYGTSGAQILYYDTLGGISSNSAVSTGTFTLPATLDISNWGKDYYVYILAEQSNGSKTTDYASKPALVDVPIAAELINYNVHIDVVYPGGIDASGTSGTVTVDKTQAKSGESITVTAIPNSGYVLQRIEWSNGPNGTRNDITSVKTITVGDDDPYIYVTFWTEPKPNTSFSVKAKTFKIKYKKLKKKAQSITGSKVMIVCNAQGDLKYSLVSVKRGKSKKFKKYFKINANTGNVTIKKKLKKGTYKVTCKVIATGNVDYKSAAKSVTFIIKVK